MIYVYESAVDHVGRYGAAFERDDDTAFFYLLDLERDEGNQILEPFDAHTVMAMPADAPVSIRWSSGGEVAGLFVAHCLVAVFDLQRDDRKGRWATSDDSLLFITH